MNPEGKVFIVDDDQAMRQSLRWLLESAGLEVETFDSAQRFLDAYYPGRAGCLLLDVRMPGMSGLDLQAYLKRQEIAIPIVIITGHGDVGMAVQAMRMGAMDFVEKPFGDEALLASLWRALDQGQRDRDRRARQAEILANLATLTPREHEVMDMVTGGRSNREIAETLGVSAKTVEVHRSRVMEKMQAGSLAELVRMAVLVQKDPS